MNIINGWMQGATRVISPNYNNRPDGTDISLLVIHNISLPPGQFGGKYIEQFFCNKLPASEHSYFREICQLEVSSHLLIARTGQVTQFVSFEDRAWHAGQSCFQGRSNCNDFSIGIELEGTDEIPYTNVQYQRLAEVTRLLQESYPAISSDRIVGHNEIAPGRKTDPGEAFDWLKYKNSLALE